MNVHSVIRCVFVTAEHIPHAHVQYSWNRSSRTRANISSYTMHASVCNLMPMWLHSTVATFAFTQNDRSRQIKNPDEPNHWIPEKNLITRINFVGPCCSS